MSRSAGASPGAWRIGALLAAALVACMAEAAPEEYVVDPGHTYPSFEVLHLGISTQRGRFDRTGGRIVLDREAETGTIEITIETGAVSTGNAFLDEALRGADFFQVDRHPRITYRAGRMEFERGVPVRAIGELTLLGVTRPVVLAIERFGCTLKPLLVRTTCGADAIARISRSAFGMTSYLQYIGDEVRIVIQIEAARVAKPAEPVPGN